MEYYEVDVVFEEEVSTKSGIKMRKIRRKYLVFCQCTECNSFRSVSISVFIR